MDIIEILREKLKEVEGRLYASPEWISFKDAQKKVVGMALYQDSRALKRMIADEEAKQQTPEERFRLKQEEEKIAPVKFLHEEEPKLVKGDNGRSTGWTKDMDSSPVAHLRVGERIRTVYDLVEKFVKELGGEASVDDISEHLEVFHNIKWEKGKRFTNYISLFNYTKPDEQTLELLPQQLPGKRQMYKTVKYIGRERLAV